MTNLQTPLLHPWMIGTAIFATGMLILNVGTASAEIKNKELPYMSAADLERRCDAEKGKFSVTLTAYSCEGKGGTVEILQAAGPFAHADLCSNIARALSSRKLTFSSQHRLQENADAEATWP